MPSQLRAPSTRIPIEALTPAAFSLFGTVIENPHPTTIFRASQGPTAGDLSTISTENPAVLANQGTSLKYVDISEMHDLYGLAPSKKASKAVMNMFVCMPRDLRAADDAEGQDTGLFDVKILERHPFTTQTFIPLGLPADSREAAYLVIVAPSLPPSKIQDKEARPPPFPRPEPRRKRSLKEIFTSARPPPFPEKLPRSYTSSSSIAKPTLIQRHPGPGLPDTSRIHTFLARGNQAVTYGAGTWHSPMVTVGNTYIDFAVVQFANGVAKEDCQEVELCCEDSGEGIVVVVPKLDGSGGGVIGGVRARL